MSLTERVERAETEVLWELAQSPPPVAEALGISGRRFGAAMAMIFANDRSDYWSQAHGFGFDSPIDSALIGEVLAFARSADARVLNFHLAPEVLPDDWDEICAEHGLTRGGTWVKAVRAAGPVEPVETDLRIAQVEPDGFAQWSAVVVKGFGMPDETGGVAAMLTAWAARPGVRLYGAWAGSELVGVGALGMAGGVGELVCGATLPAYRGRGAQSAIMARRLEDAYAAGCSLAASETGKPGPGEHNSSLANMERRGFKIAYERPIYRWQA
ncbi:GNAT family N-acetyltransferase [Kribbella sandramycini]|uniref:GNAT family N-acetyltransferase n=1 Tax=Kribbella sandramycini TaxID=60450 RepID=A0A7Y4NYJ4_9ACTN|nr:GNAT family N-acetyltransferase [Kribbella sandramycini]MBB6569570.1 GNAT superfamily N-acetyltransferase [Kribbella sandramycini]NOL40596.1 GNAT family N-acetyltransferase [Kribbella sandramycini]